MQSKRKLIDLESAVRVLENGLPPQQDSGFLGVDLNPEDASLIIIPVEWEATTSYGGGTSSGPNAVIAASHQLDVEDSTYGKIYRAGIAILEEQGKIRTWNAEAKAKAEMVTRAFHRGEKPASADVKVVNGLSDKVNALVYETAQDLLTKNKIAGVLGGDHSSPFGLIKALTEKYSTGFSILHFDAHHDLRDAYEGFQHSHASIFHNVMEEFSEIIKLTQVAIRDFSAAEKTYMKSLSERKRGSVFYSSDIFAKKARGQTFAEIASEIISTLDPLVYVSFDIDGLDPAYCPSTGTPVPGGLSFEEACFILESLTASKRKIIGFDLCEVAPGPTEWDANVGARLLYKICGATLRSQKLV